MAKINLLPWRAERRKQRERAFYMMLGAAALAAVAACLLWWYWMGMRIDNQDSRNAYLTSQIKELDSKLTEIKDLETTKSKLLARKQVIEQLQASRAQMVHLFDELVKTIPEGARLATLKQTADVLTLQGVAQSNASVAAYMGNLDKSKYLQSSDLQKTEVKGTDKRNRFEFGLTVKLRSADKVEDKPAGTDGAAPATTTTPPGTVPPPASTTPAPAAPSATTPSTTPSSPPASPPQAPAAGGKP